MKRSDLSELDRTRLAKLVGALYQGQSLMIPATRGEHHPTYITFRLAGEELPDLPLSDPELSFSATDNAIFISAATYVGVPGHGNTPIDYRWMGSGQLDEILITLQRFGDVPDFLEAWSAQSAFRAGMNVPVERGFLEVHLKARQATERPDEPQPVTAAEIERPRG